MEKQNTETKIALLEAALFMTEKPLHLYELKGILKMKEDEIKILLNKLKERYQKNESGIELSEIGGLRLTVKPEYIDKVSKLTRHADMSRGLLRVLSVITRYEPVTQSDLVKVLGNRVYEYIKELEERGFVKTEKHSRTKKISTTKLFEEYFGAKKEDIKNLAK